MFRAYWTIVVASGCVFAASLVFAEKESVGLEAVEKLSYEGNSESLKKIKARGKLPILEEPSVKNGQILSVRMEVPDGGADWFEFEIQL